MAYFGMVVSLLSLLAVTVSADLDAIKQEKEEFNKKLMAGWVSENSVAVGDTVIPGMHWDPEDHSGLDFDPDGVEMDDFLYGTVLSAPSGEKATMSVSWHVPGKQDEVKDSVRYGNGVHDVVVVSDIVGMDTAKAMVNVPRMQWVNDHFAEHAAGADQPLILEGSLVHQWHAIKTWTLDSLTENISTLEGVKVTAISDPPRFFYYHRAPMNSVDDLVSSYKSRTFSKHNMSAAEFLHRARNPSEEIDDIQIRRSERQDDGTPPTHVKGLHYSWAGKLDVFGVDRLADVFPLDPLMVLSKDFDPENENLFRSTHVWISPKDSITPLHYDISQNFFVQISGEKRVLIFPPDAWEILYPYPVLHPGGLSAQVDLNAPYEAQHKLFEGYTKGRILAYEAILKPGDVLYIPPMWFHHVTSLSESVSLSVWSPYEASEIYNKLLEEYPLPIKSSWEDEAKVAALRLLLDSIVQSLFPPPSDDDQAVHVSDFVKFTLLDSRYARIKVAVPGAQDPFVYCWNREREDEIVLEYEEIFAKGLKPIVAQFREIAKIGGEARQMILLTNYIELSVFSVVGMKNTAAFLTSIVEC